MSRGGPSRGRGRGGRGGFGSGPGGGMGDYSMVGPVCLEPPPLFPALEAKPLPLTDSADIQYAAEVKQELLNRFQESPYFLECPKPSRGKDIHRYTDKYRQTQKEAWTPDWSRLPTELRWDAGGKKLPSRPPPTKKRRIDVSSLNEEEDGKSPGKKGSPGRKEKDGEEEEAGKPPVEEEPLSDDDLEEENDYIQSYFDNGEGYLEESDDNLDEDATY